MPGFEEIRCLDASLAEKLSQYTNHLQKHNSDISKVYSTLVSRLRDADAGSGAVQTGSTLPEFLLPDSNGDLVSSAKLLSEGPLVVSFNRGHWCSYCKLELLALAEIYPAIKSLGGELVALMPESAEYTGNFKSEFELPFQILTDIDNGYALSCGLMVSLGSAIQQVYLNLGRDLSEFHRNKAWFVPIPATYIIGSDGRVVSMMVDADFRNRMDPTNILTCLEDQAV